jgi:sugar phosphate isomerase/epimerase
MEEEYRPLLEIAEDNARRAGVSPTLVVHAAVSRHPVAIDSLVDDTRAYLGWIAQAFPDVRIALENNHPVQGSEIKICVGRADVLKISGCLPASRLGICWDMGHDYLSGAADEPSPEWLSRVIHVHVHDVDEHGNDHFPLIFGRVPYFRWLKALKEAGMKGIVVLELKGEHLRGWSFERVQDALTGSIAAIAEAVT